MYIESFLKQQRVARQAEKVIDITQGFLKNRNPILNEMFPLSNRDGKDWLQYIVEETDPIASIVSPTQEFPAWQGNKFIQVLDRMPSAALSIIWDAEMQERAKEVADYVGDVTISTEELFTDVGQSKVDLNSSLTNTNTSHSKYESLVKHLFGSEIKLINAHYNIIDILAYQLLQTGTINYIDPRTQRRVVYDWRKVVSSTYNHFPDVGKDIAYFNQNGADKPNIAGNNVRDWTKWATADGLEDLYSMAYAYREDMGKYPDFIMMSTQAMYNLLKQESTKRAVVDTKLLGNVNLVGTVTLEIVNNILASKGLPNITLNDDQYTLDDLNTGNTITRQRFLDPTVVVMGSRNMGERVFGSVVDNNFRGGIYTTTKSLNSRNAPNVDITISQSSPIAICTTIARSGFARKVTTKSSIQNTIRLNDFSFS
ncbi:MAG: hypothetical protein CV045_07380 [Cyanobacteria bacterium M5B4]|nr:MAG: hypothetical protein CV045_07380 [Cyanobacteria bacterium M5B4]